MALLISCWVGSAICWLSDTLLGIIRPPSFWVRVGWVRLFAENSRGSLMIPNLIYEQMREGTPSSRLKHSSQSQR